MGIKLRARPERNSAQTTVHGVEPKGPAELAGIRKGHVIVEVNGKCVVGWDHDQIVEAMRTGSLEVCAWPVQQERPVLLANSTTAKHI